MAEELSPESKLYVKEEIEKSRKEFKEDLEKAQSKATKTFTTVALIVGLLTCGGVYGLVVTYMKSETIARLESAATAKHDSIVALEAEANLIVAGLKKNQLADPNGYAWIGDIKLVWGTGRSTTHVDETFYFGQNSFDKACFTVITSLAGEVKYEKMSKTEFTFNRLVGYKGKLPITYVAIGH